MKKWQLSALVLPLVLLCGCSEAKAENISEPAVNTSAAKPAETTTVSSAPQETQNNAPKASLLHSSAQKQATETTIAQSETNLPEENTVAADFSTDSISDVENTESSDEEQENFEVFTGVLIDEDCSDFENPPKHDLPCMLMDSCRASGYGIDIQQENGSWLFYMFDEKGQELSWDYLIHTDRMDGLYVSVTGTFENGIIYVDKLEEI